jgi:hypothetical protein
MCVLVGTRRGWGEDGALRGWWPVGGGGGMGRACRVAQASHCDAALAGVSHVPAYHGARGVSPRPVPTTSPPPHRRAPRPRSFDGADSCTCV